MNTGPAHPHFQILKYYGKKYRLHLIVTSFIFMGNPMEHGIYFLHLGVLCSYTPAVSLMRRLKTPSTEPEVTILTNVHLGPHRGAYIAPIAVPTLGVVRHQRVAFGTVSCNLLQRVSF